MVFLVGEGQVKFKKRLRRGRTLLHDVLSLGFIHYERLSIISSNRFETFQ